MTSWTQASVLVVAILGSCGPKQPPETSATASGSTSTSGFTSIATDTTSDTTSATSTTTESSPSTSLTPTGGPGVECQDYLSDPFHEIWATSINVRNQLDKPILWVFGSSTPGEDTRPLWIESLEGGPGSIRRYECEWDLCEYRWSETPACGSPICNAYLIAPGANVGDGPDDYVWWDGDVFTAVEMPASCASDPNDVESLSCNIRTQAAMGGVYRAHAWVSQDLSICDPAPCACPDEAPTCWLELPKTACQPGPLHAVSEPFEFYSGIVDIVFKGG